VAARVGAEEWGEGNGNPSLEYKKAMAFADAVPKGRQRKEQWNVEKISSEWNDFGCSCGLRT
jgi:hypothetical protein